MLASGCIENSSQCLLQVALKIQYSKGKEKVVISVQFINANLLAVGDTTYAYFFCEQRIQLDFETELLKLTNNFSRKTQGIHSQPVFKNGNVPFASFAS